MASKRNTAGQGSGKSTAVSSAPSTGGSSGGLDLSGLQDALQNTVGSLTQALGGVVGAAGQTVGGLLSQLTGTLKQLQQASQRGDEQASQVYGEVLSVLRRPAGEGKGEASDLLDDLGEEKQGR